MDVEIDGVCVRLRQEQVIGVGGEGTVFLAAVHGQQVAVKIYHQPTIQRQEKLQAFLAQQWHLPQDRMALPLHLVHDTVQGDSIGLTMPYIGPGFEEIARLANKKHRAATQISTRDIVKIFLDGYASLERIHQSGLVVGDFNDQNALYKGTTMLWVDVDAWQFPPYACAMATEDFIAPELYGIDLGLKPVFEPAHDWYAFAIHLFRGLLLAHPYGGAHKEFQTLTRRAQQRIFVLHPSVIYPKIAYPPNLLSDELADVFERIFAQGWRGRFPQAILQDYQDTLTECRSCAMQYPQNRHTCPLCQAKTLVVIQQPRVSGSGISCTELLHTQGKFIFAKVQGEIVYALAYEHGEAVIYIKKPGLAPRRTSLFKEMPGARYDLISTTLIVNMPHTTSLLFVDVSGEQAVPLFHTETALFAGSRRAMFQASRQHIFSIVNNALMCSTIEDSALSGRALRSVMENQTWFSAAPTTPDGRPTVFGFFQVFRQQLYWLIRGHAVYDVALPELQPAESLLDLAVHFSDQGALVRRHTQERGVEYLRTEMLDNQGHVVYTAAKVRRSNHPGRRIHGQAYATGMLLHAVDTGIVQEKVEQHTFKTFSATRDYVQEGDTLELYQAGLLIVREERVDHLLM